MSAREKLGASKSPLGPGEKDGILWIKGQLEQKCPQMIVRGPFVVEKSSFAK
jgi:hypothetical protein